MNQTTNFHHLITPVSIETGALTFVKAEYNYFCEPTEETWYNKYKLEKLLNAKWGLNEARKAIEQARVGYWIYMIFSE
jgi:hypothetical protein